MAKRIHRTDYDFNTGSTDAQPRMRVNRSESLTITDEWQRLDFNGTSPLNINTFPDMDGAGKKVDWDSENKKFLFNETVDRNYTLQLFYNFNGGLRPVDILLRMVIPSPSPIYFPFPDGRQYTNLVGLDRKEDVGDFKEITIYANSSIRDNGLAFEMKCEQTLILIQRPVLIDTAFLIYAR